MNTFEIDPPDEPCPDCGSTHHRACDGRGDGDEPDDSAYCQCAADWTDGTAICQSCGKVRSIVEDRQMGSPDERLSYESSQRDMEESVTQTPHASAAAECGGPTADRPLPEGHESGAGSAAPVKFPPEKCPRCGSTCRDLFLMPCNDDYWEKTHGADPYHYAARVAPARDWEVRDTGDYKKGFADGKASGKQTDWRGASVAEGMKLARGIFALRGNHSEIHLSEQELATQLALAFEHGVRAAARAAKGNL